MGNERNEQRRRRRDDDGRRWGRDEDDDYGRRETGRGEYGRFAQDEDAGGRGRSMWGEQGDRRWRDDDDMRMRGREQLPSVGSPGVGGGTGGWWDQGYEDRGRGGEELRYGRGGGTYGRELDESRRFGGGRRLEDETWERSSYGRGREEGARYFGGRGMATSSGWGPTTGGGGYGEGDEDWSPGQTGMERTARGWGGGVGRQPRYEAGRMRGRPLTSTGQRGFAGKGPMNYQRPDPRIHEDVCDRLTEDDEVDASQIEIKVEHGEVTLTGTVGSREMKRRAEEIAEDVPGVKDVHNQMRVRDRSERDEGPSGRTGGNGNGDRRTRA